MRIQPKSSTKTRRKAAPKCINHPRRLAIDIDLNDEYGCKEFVDFNKKLARTELFRDSVSTKLRDRSGLNRNIRRQNNPESVRLSFTGTEIYPKPKP